jgi:paired amphipathic helix protein Sin3a
MRELRVEDALIYLDDVKREFGDRPAIYNEFLEIMKNFKSQVVDTPGVIDRVSRLFRGYNKLILGFNKFLPDGYKISLQDLERNDAEEAARQRAAAAAGSQHMGAAKPSYFQGGHQASQPGVRPAQPGSQQVQSGHLQGPEVGAMQARASSSPTSGQQVPTQSYQRRPGAGVSTLRTVPHPPAQRSSPEKPMGQPMPSRQPQPAQQQHQAVEFDHAISYVTNIKKRFANDPGTYHAFLEILHTYQKEQRGIKEVLEQVAALFADHPDLLKEFTFFLPDAVQEQAKERLHRAAADSEARQAAAAQRADPGVYAEPVGRHVLSPGYGSMRVETGRLALQQAQATSSEGQKFIDMTGQVCSWSIWRVILRRADLHCF